MQAYWLAMDELPARARYSASLLVAIGWFVTVVVSAILGNVTLPDKPRDPTADECQAAFSCLSRAQTVEFGLLLSTPVLMGLLLVTMLLLIGLTRVFRSALLAGSAGAAGSMAIAGCVLFAWLGSR
jgi:hypothetical protein